MELRHVGEKGDLDFIVNAYYMSDQLHCRAEILKKRTLFIRNFALAATKKTIY